MRDRHVPHVWNSCARNLQDNLFYAAYDCWMYLDWFGPYYQHADFWIYHHKLGWLFPESDIDGVGVKLCTQDNIWLWTREDIYPYVWNYNDNAWYTI